MRKPAFPSATKLIRKKLYLAMLASSQVLFSQSVLAGPDGGRITGGNGAIDQDGRVTTIEQYTDRLSIDWDSFDLSPEDIVNYLQPDSNSIALNRILSNNGSQILGQINANGHVVLVNPHGIVFGEGAQVNVGGLIASGLSVDTDDFLNGEFTFSGLDEAGGTVVNQGLIQAATGGSVTLLGKQVRNEGLISANLGAVNLAAGKEAVVTFDDSGLMGVRVTKAVLQDKLGVDAALINEGGIEAAGGRILMTASTSRDIFSQAVNTGDLTQARSVTVHDDGSFTLGGGADVVNAGELNVSHADVAGDVVLLGENVTQEGLIQANILNADAGHIEIHANHTALLAGDSISQARSEAGGQGGQIKVLGHHVGLFDEAYAL